MSLTTKTFDIKKFARAVLKQAGEDEAARNPDALGPEHLTPGLQKAYIQILREDTFTLADIDFGEIGEDDIDDLETVLNYSPANRLFHICEVFKDFEASAAVRRAFI
jgi:hypothetical protein